MKFYDDDLGPEILFKDIDSLRFFDDDDDNGDDDYDDYADDDAHDD